MTADLIGRTAELHAVAEFLDSIADGPAALILHGEAGIGKTTLWEAALADAARRGYSVLRCRPTQSEARLSFASIADLLMGIDAELMRGIPEPQHQALQVALLKKRPAGATPDQRATATAVVTILDRLVEKAPVIIAIDDIQWLDRASARVVEFAARRLVGRVGIVASMRTRGIHELASALQLADPQRIRRLEVGPLGLVELHDLLKDRTGRTYPRPALERIQQVSGGNPFFALELVRVLGERPALAPNTRFPASVAELARSRFEGIDERARELLLATAALATPTVELLQRAVHPDAARLLGPAEDLGLVVIDGTRVRFTHPILASGAYAMASASQRRDIHRRLAAAGLDAEERARHLALAAPRADPETIAALDDAAVHARRRGAAAAAAELLELALRLGADDPARAIRAARHHFDSGDPMRARPLLEATIARLPPGVLRADAMRLLATVRLHDDSYQEAAELLEAALTEAAADQALRVQVALELQYVLTNLGRIKDALDLIEPVIEDAEDLGDPGLIAQALAALTITRFLNGQGLDETRLARALILEDRGRATAVMFRPSLIAGLLWMWTGRLEKARETFYRVRRECLERGEETDLMFVAFHTVMLECWRGDLQSAGQVADDTYERALQLGTDVPRAIALSTIANAAAHAGDANVARAAAEAALAIFMRGTCLVATLWPLATLGFLEISLDDFEAAANRLAPMAAGAAAMGVLEPVCIPFAADAAEALIALGRLEQAAELVDQLEGHGLRLDRAWAVAAGGRCRALLLAARGELEPALAAGARALAQHERLAMPLEQARTQLVMGRIQRRQGSRRAARASLEQALATFQGMGARLWADKARGELARLGSHAVGGAGLTASEQRVAELAAAGMTNREVAATLLISPKTVEANLARIYHKLEIHSRAELGRKMSKPS
ncbi:MAG: LuxR family transcriptional regulator [Candidatus Dormibacteraceae bacterium]